MRIARVSKALLFTLAVALSGIGISGAPDEQQSKPPEDSMSSMARIRARARASKLTRGGDSQRPLGEILQACLTDPNCLPDSQAAITRRLPSTQSEVTIAVDATGQHIVIGFNDFRGFLFSPPLSTSGVLYSDDGGVTFVDGGRLPAAGSDGVFGDPDVKYIGDCTFIYSSLIDTPSAETLGIHRSTDCGHTWQGPFEVTAASLPNGSADKEFLDVDPNTGRVVMSWSNFRTVPPFGVESISTTYSDNILATPPTWSPRQVVAATANDGQASIPRFSGDGHAYIAWMRFFPGRTNGIGFARSDNNGETWSDPVNITTPFFTMDQVLGNDRVNSSPSLAVDTSAGAHPGSVYVVYASNALRDGADVLFQRSTDQGVTFSQPLRLNSRPGDDRAQWFPWVTVDKSTGRVHVFYLDQGIATSGHETELTHTWSDDGGVSWNAPLPLTDRPFKAGWGNDTSQPNLGDYNQAVAQGGELFVAWGGTFRPPLGFVDGLPLTSLTVPDVFFRRLPRRDFAFKAPPVNLFTVNFTESGGNGHLDPGDRVRLQVWLRNYVTNPLSAEPVRRLSATLTSPTPGVEFIRDFSDYPNLTPGEYGVNRRAYILRLLPSFVPGTPIELALRVHSARHEDSTLLQTLFSGTPAATTILTEDFDSVPPGSLPAGWTAAHGAGGNTVPWTTSNTFCGTGSNAAFHQNENDGPPGVRPSRWERLFSPDVSVPANAEYVTLQFDVCYDTEDDPDFNILAYDGFFLRIADSVDGTVLRSVLVEAFEDEFFTGSLLHYPKHFPRNNDPFYFQDMSAWSGDSGGFRHVWMRLPGMAGRTVQLRFEYAQDGSDTCADVRPGHTCGVTVDNIVMKSVISTLPARLSDDEEERP